MLLTLALVTALFRPAAPTVGDPVTIQFEAPVRLDPSPDFELMSQSGPRVVIRTFKPEPLPLSGVAGNVRFRNLVLPMQSVLKPNDDMKPAPLVPPRPLAAPRAPYYWILGAALFAIAAWAWAWSRRSAKAAAPARVVPPAEAFRGAILKASKARQRWAALADATRTYLAARGLARELTTSELLAEVPVALDHVPQSEREAHAAAVADILRRGDYEKFSPWGAPEGDFDAVARRAMMLIDAFEPPPAPAEEAAA